MGLKRRRELLWSRGRLDVLDPGGDERKPVGPGRRFTGMKVLDQPRHSGIRRQIGRKVGRFRHVDAPRRKQRRPQP